LGEEVLTALKISTGHHLCFVRWVAQMCGGAERVGDHLCLIFFATFLYQDKRVGERKYWLRRGWIAVKPRLALQAPLSLERKGDGGED